MKNYHKIYSLLFVLQALQIQFQNVMEERPEVSKNKYGYEGFCAGLSGQWLVDPEDMMEELTEMEEQSVELEENLNTTIKEILTPGNTSEWLMAARSLQIQLNLLQTEIRDAVNNLKGTSKGKSPRHLHKALLKQIQKDQVISRYPRRFNSCPDIPAVLEGSGSLTKSMSKNHSLDFKESFKITLSEISKKIHTLILKNKQLHKCLHKLPEPEDQRPSTFFPPHGAEPHRSESNAPYSSDTSETEQDNTWNQKQAGSSSLYLQAAAHRLRVLFTSNTTASTIGNSSVHNGGQNHSLTMHRRNLRQHWVVDTDPVLIL
ncbi:uncharacterized protein LOC113160650 isoform X2 [Anabas testudineus]|uniref:uncharacterized protein LOC113160650 isoform X2 n=1 Tax=Anabas testudineus TaxID=64144 RepID=UPI000E455B86|nr:uncharacterized protein LOC113160650 isoform X2 [Anabas testudineus]XP_026213796.1 uncharacterized protein LOC113160650 isoform X2 [Anabas testudineus]